MCHSSLFGKRGQAHVLALGYPSTPNTVSEKTPSRQLVNKGAEGERREEIPGPGPLVRLNTTLPGLSIVGKRGVSENTPSRQLGAINPWTGAQRPLGGNLASEEQGYHRDRPTT